MGVVVVAKDLEQRPGESLERYIERLDQLDLSEAAAHLFGIRHRNLASARRRLAAEQALSPQAAPPPAARKPMLRQARYPFGRRSPTPGRPTGRRKGG
jgi:hypothetical protein